MRRVAAILVCVCVALLGGAAFTAASVGARTGGPPTLASNRAAAKADATKLLSGVALPAGARRLRTEPTGDHRYLKPLAHLVATTIGVVDTRWWKVTDRTPTQVIDAIGHRPPAGSVSTGTSSGGDARTGTSETGLSFSFSDVPGVLDARMVNVTATALSGGGTGVMVQSQSVWVVPRSPASIIPDGTQAISVTETDPAGRSLSSTTVTAPTDVGAAVSYFNGLESIQPFTVSCPAEPGTDDLDTVTVTFLAGANAAPLATASFSGDFGQLDSGLSSECNPVELHVGADAAVGLLGGDYIASLNRLLGTHLR